MKTKDRDMRSFIAIVDSFIDLAELPEEEAEVIKKELKSYISVRFNRNKWVHPEITKFSTDWYREFYRLIDHKDPYEKLKNESNEVAKEVLHLVQPKNLRDMAVAGIIGNKIDYGATLHGVYNIEKLREDIRNCVNVPLHIDQTAVLQQKLQDAKTVLFLVDNNGEVIFDSLLLEAIRDKVGKENLFIMGKERPMLNDVTIQDLRDLGYEKYGTLVSTGSDCFGLHTEDVSDECKELIKDVDLIIAKGQAYLEFFTEYNFTHVMNLLTVKYPIVNPAFGTLQKGYNVVMSSEQYAHHGKSYFAEVPHAQTN